MPDLVKNDRLNHSFKHGKSRPELKRLAASVDKFQPAKTMKSPVRMQQRGWNVAFKLKDAGSQGGNDHGLCTKRRTIPRELTGWC